MVKAVLQHSSRLPANAATACRCTITLAPKPTQKRHHHQQKCTAAAPPQPWPRGRCKRTPAPVSKHHIWVKAAQCTNQSWKREGGPPGKQLHHPTWLGRSQPCWHSCTLWRNVRAVVVATADSPRTRARPRNILQSRSSLSDSMASRLLAPSIPFSSGKGAAQYRRTVEQQ